MAPMWAQHGVIREYASLAPAATATPLRPLLDIPLTDVSIAVGHDGAYYMTGSEVANNAAAFAKEIRLWRSADLKKWSVLRTIRLEGGAAQAPEVHYLKNRYWLTLGMEGGGTELIAFDAMDLKGSKFRRAKITERGADPSLFLDDDGAFYWVMGAGEIARMKADPMEGLAAEPKRVIEPFTGDVRSHAMRGAYLAKIHGYYHLFVGERRLRHADLGRLGLAGGTDDVFVAVSQRPDGGYRGQRYLAFPHAGQTTLFRGPGGRWWATFSCTDARGIFRLKPGAFPVEEAPATEARWAIGFEVSDKPVKYDPPGVMLRPDTAYVYEAGVGLVKTDPDGPPCRGSARRSPGFATRRLCAAPTVCTI